jgi:hypothetical protein
MPTALKNITRLQTESAHGWNIFAVNSNLDDRFCGLVVRVPGYRSRGPGSIPDATRFPEK